jgi:hypothetical protein
MISQYLSSISMPIARRPFSRAAIIVPPTPARVEFHHVYDSTIGHFLTEQFIPLIAFEDSHSVNSLSDLQVIYYR